MKTSLIERNIRLVVYIARKFDNTGVGLEDLISIGTIGLIKAVNTFDASKNIKLATYASRCIENEILMFLRRTSRTKKAKSLWMNRSMWIGMATNCCSRISWAQRAMPYLKKSKAMSSARSLPKPSRTSPPGKSSSSICVLVFPASGRIRKSKSRMRWAFHRAIFPAWKSASSDACKRRLKNALIFLFSQKAADNRPLFVAFFALPAIFEYSSIFSLV